MLELTTEDPEGTAVVANTKPVLSGPVSRAVMDCCDWVMLLLACMSAAELLKIPMPKATGVSGAAVSSIVMWACTSMFSPAAKSMAMGEADTILV
jgi:hypothetical protein